MQQPRGIAVILGVVISLGIIAVAVTGVVLVQRKPAVPAATNTNGALNLACTIDADCSSYCGADQCYQPICGTTTIGGSGSCTCRSLCGPIAPAVNTNTTVNTNVATNGNTNTAPDPTAGWKTYTNEQYSYQVRYPTAWKLTQEISPKRIVLSPPDAGERTSLEYSPSLYIQFKSTITTGELVRETKKVIINTIAATQQTESGMADYSNTYFPTTSGYINVMWPGLETDDTYKQILSTFTFTK